MPSSLISFCLGATFDTLPSPSNLKCWRLITESSCFLCRKSICTSAHILGTSKIVLHQSRFSFRHDKLLCELVRILKNFLSSYKPNKSSVLRAIPVFLAVSTLRPDVLLFSRSPKKVIITELTCPCEENMSQWHEEKYPLSYSIRSNG